MAAAELGHRHPETQRLRALLREPATRRSESAFVLEGPRLVADALARGVTLQAVYVGVNADRAFAALLARVRAAGVPVHGLKEGVLEKLGTTRTPQPVLGIVSIPAPVPLDDLPPGLVVVTVGVQDPGNLGTIVRSAEAAGATAVVVGRGEHGVDPWNPKVVRGSAGAVLGIPVTTVDDPAAGLRTLRARDFRAVGAEASGARPYTDVELSGACALVIGSEAHGLGDAVEAELDEIVSIPMAGPTESLNAGVAASILLFEAARQARG